MRNQPTKAKIVTSLLWKLMERGGNQGIQFMVQIVLARLLLPEDYGIVTLITIFIVLANVFVQSGFNTALVQKKDVDDEDFSSVFYLSLFVACLLYMVIFFCAPVLAGFFRNFQLVQVFRVLSITLFFGAFNTVQNAIIARRMLFKTLFISSLGAVVISGIIGIIAAYKNLGVWALVMQQIANQLVITLTLCFTIKWRPKLLFSFVKIKLLFSFGSKLLASSLIETFYNNLRSLFIGKIYNSSMLGFYSKGQQFPSLIVTNINDSIQSVMLPALSSYQDNRQRVKEMVRRSIVTSSFFIFPMMVALAVMAEPLVTVLLSDKWLPAVPFLQIYCFSFSLWPIHTANLQAINALGYSNIFLKLEILKKVVGFTILIITIYYGVYAIAIGEIIVGLIASFINAYPNKKLLKYSFKEQYIDIMPSLVLSLVMGGVIYIIGLVGLNIWLTLIFQMIVGSISYLGLARLFQLECFQYILYTVSDLFLKKMVKEDC